MSLKVPEVKVLNEGYCRYISHMGDDLMPLEAARMSTNNPTGEDPAKDAATRDYLWRHEHATPFEMSVLQVEIQCPIFVAREWMRHRTFCLSGDTVLHFDLPGGVKGRGSQIYKKTIKEIFDWFHNTEAKSGAAGSRNRATTMMLRSVNETTKEVYHTNVTDIWESGVKPVYRITLADGSSSKMSKDHLCLTDAGWLRLEEAVDLETGLSHVKFMRVGKGRNGAEPFAVSPTGEHKWAPIRGWEDYYEISTYGQIRRKSAEQGTRAGREKKATIHNGRVVVSLNRPGVQTVAHVSVLLLESFVGQRPAGNHCCHIDGNSLNNNLENLRWGTSSENSNDNVVNGVTNKLSASFEDVESVKYVGDEMTYDLSVSGPYHNFVAGGMVVHNSYNEFSQRYSEALDLYYIPESDRIASQSSTNKQSSGDSLDSEEKDSFLRNLNHSQEMDKFFYKSAIDAGIAKELARIHIPVSNYTKFRVQGNLRNWLHFIDLRIRENAQYEIRCYAEIIFGMIQELWPETAKVFEEHTLCGEKFSKTEMDVIKKILSGYGSDSFKDACGDLPGNKVRTFMKKVGL